MKLTPGTRRACALTAMTAMVLPLTAAPALTQPSVHTPDPTPGGPVTLETQSLDHATEDDLRDAVERARETRGLQITEADPIVREVDATMTQEAFLEAHADYARQIAEIDQAIEQATEAMAMYDYDMNYFEQAKAQFDNALIAREEVQATRDQLIADNEAIVIANQELTDKYDEAMAAYDQAVEHYNEALALREEIERFNDEAEAINAGLMDLYSVEVQAYEDELARYNQLKTEYDQQIALQIGEDANPEVALSPERLAIDQPFEIIENRNDLHSVEHKRDGRNRTCSQRTSLWTLYNSNRATLCTVQNGDTITATWRNRAVDKATGRRLNLEIFIDNIVIADKSPGLDKHPHNPAGKHTVMVYSNSIDNFGLDGVASVDQTYRYTYADTGEAYDKPYYLTIGSLDFSEEARPNSGHIRQNPPTFMREFVAPKEGVIASFIGKDSIIGPYMQTVFGEAATVTPRAFYALPNSYPEVLRWHDDSQDEAISMIGVTFLVDGEATVATGNSRSSNRFFETREASADGRNAGFAYRWMYNHILSSYATVAPTIEDWELIPPTPPEEPDWSPTKPMTDLPPEPVEPEALELIPLNELPEVPGFPMVPILPIEPNPVNAEFRLWDIRQLALGQLHVHKDLISDQAYLHPGDEVTFQLEVGNLGQSRLRDVTLFDFDAYGLVDGSLEFVSADNPEINLDDAQLTQEGLALSLGELAPGEVHTLTATAQLDQFPADSASGSARNILRATSPDDPEAGVLDGEVNDSLETDTDGYDHIDLEIVEAAAPAVEITKYINGYDADTEDEAVALIDTTEVMTITYEVVNTGNTRLVDLEVTDDVEWINEMLIGIETEAGVNGDITLDVGESVTITLTGVTAPEHAQLHVNTGTITGTPDDPRVIEATPVSNDDSAHAFRFNNTAEFLPNTGGQGVYLWLLAALAFIGAGIAAVTAAGAAANRKRS